MLQKVLTAVYAACQLVRLGYGMLQSEQSQVKAVYAAWQLVCLPKGSGCGDVYILQGRPIRQPAPHHFILCSFASCHTLLSQLLVRSGMQLGGAVRSAKTMIMDGDCLLI